MLTNTGFCLQYVEMSPCLRLVIYGFNDCTIPPVAISDYTYAYSGFVGRPRIVVNIDAAEFLRNSGYTWTEVANALQVNRTTLWRRLKEYGIHVSQYSDISADELDQTLTEIQRENPNCGQQLMVGYLLAKGIRIQCYRLRDSVKRTDPLRRFVRWHEVITRCTYCVKHSNSLWHIDGHHSLVRWRLIVHGGIDGFSRVVVYLSCSTNN